MILRVRTVFAPELSYATTLIVCLPGARTGVRSRRTGLEAGAARTSRLVHDLRGSRSDARGLGVVALPSFLVHDLTAERRMARRVEAGVTPGSPLPLRTMRTRETPERSLIIR